MEESLIFTCLRATHRQAGFGIEQRLRSFARLITQDFGLKVTFTGEVASLSKEGMQIPPVMDTPEAFSRAKFYVSHECGHSLHSDFSVMEQAQKEDRRLPPILNSLEDARVEKLMIGEFPGLETDMDENIQAIIKEWDIFSMSLATQLIYGMYLLGRNYPISVFNQDAQKLLYEFQPEILQASVADDCQTVCKQAKKILSKIDLLIQEEQPTPTLSEEAREQLEETDFSGSSISDEIKAHFDEVKLEKGYDGMQNCECFKDENNPEEKTVQRPPEGDLSEYQRLLNPLLVEYNVLKLQLEKIVAQRRTKKKRMAHKQRQTKGVIDTKRIWKIATKENNLFKQRKVGEARTLQVDPDSLAIYILLDESGSMEEKDRIEYAQKAAIIVAETLYSLKIPFALTGYTVSRQRLVRICYKDFFDEFKKVKLRLLSIRDRDGTFTAEHLPFAKRRLEGRKERKKLLIVITDATDIESEVRLKKAMQELKDAGIFVIGIGIHTNLMASYYDRFIEIEQIGGFAKELLSLLKTVLTCLPLAQAGGMGGGEITGGLASC